MRTIVILTLLSVLFSLSSCKKKKEPITVAPITTTTVEPPKTDPIVEVKKPEPVVEQMNYYLVAGCFEFKNNADRLNAQLQKEGYASKIMPFYNLYMVTYNGYRTRQEAQVALNRIVLEPGKSEAWVYPVK